MNSSQNHSRHWIAAVLAAVIGSGMTPTNQDSRAVYWFFSLNDAAEIQFHGSALNEAVTVAQFIESLPTDSSGALYLAIEGSTGWFLDTPDNTATAASSSASVSQSADAAPAAAAPEENQKTRTVELMRIWAHDDDFNDVASWTFNSVVLTGRTVGTSYLVRVNYESAQVETNDR